MWVGPFWLAMLIYPEHERTKKILRGPWFFIGPIAIWWFVIASDPEGLSNSQRASRPLSIVDSLVGILGTRAGASAAWAHMVAGDISSPDGCGTDV